MPNAGVKPAEEDGNGWFNQAQKDPFCPTLVSMLCGLGRLLHIVGMNDQAGLSIMTMATYTSLWILHLI